MSENVCRWNGTENPRVLVGRHKDGCEGDCRGCLPCDGPHCLIDGRTHVDEQTCPECVGEVRHNLHEIGKMYAALPTQVEHVGVNSDAMMLLGPAANVEAWEHRAVSAMRGRIDDAYLADNLDEDAPLWVLGTWDQEFRETFCHPTDLRITVARAIDYLDGQLSNAAQHHDAFDEFAGALRRCVRRLEDVLKDGDRPERTKTPCARDDCNGVLTIARGKAPEDDRYVCPRCRTRYTHGEFARAQLSHLHSEGADAWVRLVDAAHSLRRPVKTLRTWVTDERVQSYREEVSGKVFVWWPDVREANIEARARNRGRRSA